MSKKLLLCAHVAEPRGADLRRAIASAGLSGWTVHAFVRPGLSRIYRALAHALRRRSLVAASPAPFLPQLLEYLHLAPIKHWERVVIATYSAGYALLEELVASPIDRRAITGWIAIDSGYAGADAGVHALARTAAEGKRLVWCGYTDLDPVAYASTAAYAAELLRAAGIEPTSGRLVEARGLLRAERWPHDAAALAAAQRAGSAAVAALWRREHRAALEVHGPSFVARALAALEGAPTGPVQEDLEADAADDRVHRNVKPENLHPLSAALVAAALRDVGVQELPGNRGERIDDYNRTARVALGSDYCAPAIMTWIREAEQMTGLRSAIPGSPAAKGIEAQFRRASLWVKASKLREHAAPGWIAVFNRAGLPPEDWRGHTGVLVAKEGDGFVCVEANVGVGVEQRWHAWSDPLLRGAGRIDTG